MQQFIAQGDHHNNLWLVDNTPVFATFPGGIVDNIPQDTPIYLKVGNKAFGAKHIEEKHARWLEKQGFSTAHELVYFKLKQAGSVYCTESETKIKIMMRLRPEAILVMEFFERPHPHLSITTIYYHQGALDGEIIGRYPGWR